MSEAQAAPHTATTHAVGKGCGCRSQGKHVQVEKAPGSAQAQPAPSMPNERAQIEKATNDLSCCCDGKTTA
jgi:hypothetical protein